MLFLLFQIGDHRYALEASRVVEVVPLVNLQLLPHAPPGVAGLFLYHGRTVPAIDFCRITLDRPARECLSTRIILMHHPGPNGERLLLGLIAENATGLLRKDLSDVSATSLKTGTAPYLGPVLVDGDSVIQCLQEQKLLPEHVRESLYSALAEHDRL